MSRTQTHGYILRTQNESMMNPWIIHGFISRTQTYGYILRTQNESIMNPWIHESNSDTRLYTSNSK